jgi:hypothetical protein
VRRPQICLGVVVRVACCPYGPHTTRFAFFAFLVVLEMGAAGGVTAPENGDAPAVCNIYGCYLRLEVREQQGFDGLNINGRLDGVVASKLDIEPATTEKA